MTSLVPYLTFAGDGEASLRFLKDVFGFEEVTVARDGGEVVHAELKRGDALVMGGVGEAARGAAPGLYLVVEDVEAVFARATAAGAEVGYEPQDTEWGTRRARIRDLDGHEWSFGTYAPGQAW